MMAAAETLFNELEKLGEEVTAQKLDEILFGADKSVAEEVVENLLVKSAAGWIKSLIDDAVMEIASELEKKGYDDTQMERFFAKLNACMDELQLSQEEMEAQA